MKREMIQEEYCKFETCKLLKEAGFPQEGGYDCFFDKEDVRYSIPKQSQAMRWLRENEALFVIVEPKEERYNGWFDCTVKALFNGFPVTYCHPKGELPPTYEAAAEIGIQAACKYIISKS